MADSRSQRGGWRLCFLQFVAPFGRFVFLAMLPHNANIEGGPLAERDSTPLGFVGTMVHSVMREFTMGVINHLLIADPSEADAVLASDEPCRAWEGFTCRGLDHIKIITLWALVETGAADDGFNERLDQIRTIPEGDQGPWVDIVPTTMLISLASIAAMEDEEQASLAEAWARTEEMEGWDAAEILDLVRSIGDMAETAQLDKKTLLIWTSV